MAQLTGKVFIVSAPSGAGKTTLVNALLQRFERFAFSVSATTRPARDYEEEGVHYYFLTESDFRARIAKGDFLEYEEVYPGRFYGTLRAEVDRILQAGKCPIFDVDVEGGLNIKQHYGDQAVAFFIRPPRPEVLRERLLLRGADSQADIESRYAKARHELTYADQFDHIILNDDLSAAIEEMTQLVNSYLTPQV